METIAAIIAIAWLVLKAVYSLMTTIVLISVASCLVADHPVQVPFIGITISPTRK